MGMFIDVKKMHRVISIEPILLRDFVKKNTSFFGCNPNTLKSALEKPYPKMEPPIERLAKRIEHNSRPTLIISSNHK